MKALTKKEEQIMEYFWDRGPLFVRELRELYASVRMRAEGIRTDAGRQSVIKDLYESFFKKFIESSEHGPSAYAQILRYSLG